MVHMMCMAPPVYEFVNEMFVNACNGHIAQNIIMSTEMRIYTCAYMCVYSICVFTRYLLLKHHEEGIRGRGLLNNH